MKPLDYSESDARHGGPSFSISNRFIRLLWKSVWLFGASWTPPVMHPWRRFLLRCFGAKIGTKSDVRGSARVWLPSNLVLGDWSILAEDVDCYNQGLVTIGNRVIVSQKCYICASGHDVDDPNFQLIVGRIEIGDNAWIAADAFIGPGAVVGVGAVAGARAVCMGRLEEYGIYVGNPARKIRSRIINENSDN